MKVVFLPTAEAVLAVNKYICEQGGNPAHCFEVKIEWFLPGGPQRGGDLSLAEETEVASSKNWRGLRDDLRNFLLSDRIYSMKYL